MTQRANSQANMGTSRIPCCAFFILLWIHVVAAAVLPPVNVTLHCHNMQNTLSWEHEEVGPGLKFKVFVGVLEGFPGEHFVNWPNMSIDLSNYSISDDDYTVMVYAVKDSDESDPVPEEGIQYSYYQDSPAKKKCGLDLPKVDVTTLEENNLHFSFTHPGVLYPIPQRTRSKRSHESQDLLPSFVYNVEILSQNRTYEYSCMERECEGKLHIDSSEKSYCLNISGEMEKMSVHATEKYCSMPLAPPGINPLTYIIPIVLLLAAVLIIGVMLVVRKIKPLTAIPTALDFPGKSNPPQTLASPTNSDYAAVDMELSSPEPLIHSEQDTSNNSSSFTFTPEVRLPLGVSNDENANEPAREGAADNGYTPGTYLENDEEEEESNSPYEGRVRLGLNQDET